MRLDDDKIEQMLYRENLKVAPLKKRIFAYFIDDALISILFIVMLFSSFDLLEDKEAFLQSMQANLMYFILLRGFYQCIFTYFYGASIGKILLKMRVVQLDTLDHPNLLNAIVRAFFRELGQMLFYITFFFALNDVFVRTLHDRIVKTIVIMQE